MARISSYPYDITVQDTDAWVGSDSINRSTKQYTAQSVADYLNIKGKISISAQMVFKYVDGNPDAGDFSGPVDGSAMTSITTMQLSIADTSGQDVVGFMNYLVGNNILISEQKNISTFGHFLIDSYTVSAAGFYTLNLSNIGGNGNLADLLYYDFAVFQLSSQGTSTTVFEQVVPSTAWGTNGIVTHNLGKFPSITVIDTGGTVVNGEYTYIDTNNIRLNFSAPFAGKAYLN
tara:strand:- start:204 stop:899 length:696 start_codon:yes stop_codon:yes gene_type:complete